MEKNITENIKKDNPDQEISSVPPVTEKEPAGRAEETVEENLVLHTPAGEMPDAEKIEQDRGKDQAA